MRFSSEWQGKRFEQWGTVLEFVAPIRLKYTLFAPRAGLEDRPENRFTMTCELQQDRGGTLLVFTKRTPAPPRATTSRCPTRTTRH